MTPGATSGHRLAVAADDRTGALETAAACADHGWEATVTGPDEATAFDRAGDCAVVDLGTRHVAPGLAAARAAAAERAAPGWRVAHKIDSTLRGNWAVEVAARHAAGRRRTVVVAAFPAAGRTCAGGVVHEHGRPVHQGEAGRDTRAPVTESRPALHLAAAGLGPVAEVGDAAGLATWLTDGGGGAAVADASDDHQIDALAALVAAHPDVLLAGTAAAIAALARALRPCEPPRTRWPGLPAGPVLVVCGSRHPAADAQVRALLDTGAAGLVETARRAELVAALHRRSVVVLRPPAVDQPVDRVLGWLAADVRAARAAAAVGTLVVLGGDTAAAVLGAGPLRVEGSAGVGVARCRPVDDDDLLVLTRPGGFGDPDALVALLADRLRP